MSYKCYYGIRFPRTKLPEFVQEVRPAQARLVEEWFLAFVAEIDTRDESYRDLARQHNKTRRGRTRHTRDCWWCKLKLVWLGIKETRRDSLQLGCGYKLWLPPGRWVYGSPWGRECFHPGLPGFVQEYGYWNNSERPEGIGKREWRRRKRAWETVFAFGEKFGRLDMVSFDAAHPYTYDMSGLYLTGWNRG